MKAFLKKILILFLIFNLTFLPVFAEKEFKMYGNVSHEFLLENLPKILRITVAEESNLPDGTIIPKNAVLELEIMQVQKERRWHKSGYILCKLKSYAPDNKNTVIDLSDKNVYLAIRKYNKVDSKDATILTSEIIVTQAAGIVGSCFIYFAPVDILYFFTKGAILREKHHNWFKAGVRDAYDNSICWFWLKGSAIELKKSEKVKIQTVNEKKAIRLNSQISKRNAKISAKNEQKAEKLKQKEEKLQAKYTKEKAKNPKKFEQKMQKRQIKQNRRIQKEKSEIARQQEILANRAVRAQKSLERKALKKQQKQQKKKQNSLQEVV